MSQAANSDQGSAPEQRERRDTTLLGSLLTQQGFISDDEYPSALSRNEPGGPVNGTAVGSDRLSFPHRAQPDRDKSSTNGMTLAPSMSQADGPFGSDPGPFTVLDQTTSIPLLVSRLFEDTARWGATDIHFDPTPAGVTVRLRIDGHLHDVGSLPEGVARHVRSRIKVLAGMDIVEKREPQDGHISLQTDLGHRDYRVATLLTGLGERMVVRSHHVADRGLTLEALGLEQDQAEAVHHLLAKPQGLVLVTGPIGSGKTTTLYACLKALATPARSLITIEDPIEYRLDGVTQVEVHPSMGLSFARGLRAILRQDPDIIMVGEIRDAQTARIASRAAAAGAVVLSSIHAADGPGVLRSLANYRLPPHYVRESLAGIIVQRLVRTLCVSCKRPIRPDAAATALLADWGLDEETRSRATMYEPVGCTHCLGTGYRGRTGIFEVIELDGQAGEWNRRGQFHRPRAFAMGRSFTILHVAALKIIRGLTTLEEVRRILLTPRELSDESPSTLATAGVIPIDRNERGQ